ncbi:hypothetical protein AVEN_90771-1 [Araneus ventricosus]|uniref:Uncharacterized protein n=1 Tax=Araneus ventricosus TaxID=182803 RepID=A0A4Y2NZA6_ARAVE|nr:hypothetical protein AVEN_90771-1 [Araneus ventricosus]
MKNMTFQESFHVFTIPASCHNQKCGLTLCGADVRAVADKCLSCCPYCAPDDEKRYTGDDVDETEYYDYPSYVPTDLDAYKATKTIMKWLYLMDGDYGDFDFIEANIYLTQVKKLSYRKAIQAYRKSKKLMESEK